MNPQLLKAQGDFLKLKTAENGLTLTAVWWHNNQQADTMRVFTATRSSKYYVYIRMNLITFHWNYTVP